MNTCTIPNPGGTTTTLVLGELTEETKDTFGVSWEGGDMVVIGIDQATGKERAFKFLNAYPINVPIVRADPLKVEMTISFYHDRPADLSKFVQLITEITTLPLTKDSQ